MTYAVTTGDITCKFGGSSLADSAQIDRVTAIIRADPRRRFVVVSAPGKRHSGDTKVTDLLYACAAGAAHELSTNFQPVRERFEAMTDDLGVTNFADSLDEVERGLANGRSREWVASRGEYLLARLFAAHIDATFVDAATCIRFTSDGRLDEASYSLTAEALRGHGPFVIPGFYGSDSAGHIRTFSRGGSDITGAIVARAVCAGLYENWTDVNGVLMADPRVVDNPLSIHEITYSELRELAYMGASVLHDQAVFPVRHAGIPIQIRDTNNPSLPGTMIVPSRPPSDEFIVGIAGRKGFCNIFVQKAMMNEELGFGRRLLQILEQQAINFEHAPGGIDTMSVIIEEQQLADKEDAVLHEIRERLQPDHLHVHRGLALIATVGQGMSHRIGVASRVFTALSVAGVNVRMINQGESEINIIVGVDDDEYERAIRAIYGAFIDGQNRAPV